MWSFTIQDEEMVENICLALRIKSPIQFNELYTSLVRQDRCLGKMMITEDTMRKVIDSHRNFFLTDPSVTAVKLQSWLIIDHLSKDDKRDLQKACEASEDTGHSWSSLEWSIAIDSIAELRTRTFIVSIFHKRHVYRVLKNSDILGKVKTEKFFIFTTSSVEAAVSVQTHLMPILVSDPLEIPSSAIIRQIALSRLVNITNPKWNVSSEK